MICPKKMRPCVDDLCYGAPPICGTGYTLDRCDKCKQLCESDQLISDVCYECHNEFDEYED